MTRKGQTMARAAILMAIRQTWKEYTNETSVHGLKYVTGRRRLDRWIWFLVPMSCTIVSVLLVIISSSRYLLEPTRTVYQTQFEPVSSAWFPAVTICAPRKFNDKNVESLIRTIKIPDNISEEAVREAIPSLLGFMLNIPLLNKDHLIILDQLMEFNSRTPEEAFKRLSPPCASILVKCRWDGQDMSCAKLFKRSKTRYGYCCSFNHISDFKDRSFETVSSGFFGPHSGLSVVVDTDGVYGKQVYHMLDSFKIMLHQSHSFAGRFTREMVMPLASDVHVAVTPVTLDTGDEVLDLPIKERRCIHKREHALEYFDIYRKLDCLAECEIAASVSRCGCQPFMYPSNHNDVICNATSIPCLSRHFQNVQSVGWVDECDCPQQCNENSTETEVYFTSLAAVQSNPDPMYNQLTPNQSLLHVYNARQTATIVKRILITHWVDLVSSFGGIFNLFVGSSFVSVLEIIYFLTCRLRRNFLKYKKVNP